MQNFANISHNFARIHTQTNSLYFIVFPQIFKNSPNPSKSIEFLNHSHRIHKSFTKFHRFSQTFTKFIFFTPIHTTGEQKSQKLPKNHIHHIEITKLFTNSQKLHTETLPRSKQHSITTFHRYSQTSHNPIQCTQYSQKYSQTHIYSHKL